MNGYSNGFSVSEWFLAIEIPILCKNHGIQLLGCFESFATLEASPVNSLSTPSPPLLLRVCPASCPYCLLLSPPSFVFLSIFRPHHRALYPASFFLLLVYLFPSHVLTLHTVEESIHFYLGKIHCSHWENPVSSRKTVTQPSLREMG